MSACVASLVAAVPAQEIACTHNLGTTLVPSLSHHRTCNTDVFIEKATIFAMTLWRVSLVPCLLFLSLHPNDDGSFGHVQRDTQAFDRILPYACRSDLRTSSH